MDRKEAYRRIDAAVCILRSEGGWTDSDVDRAFSGLSRDEAVEHAERCAKNVLGFEDRETTKDKAMEALKRAHDAVAELNASGAYNDIVNDLRSALAVLDPVPRSINKRLNDFIEGRE